MEGLPGGTLGLRTNLGLASIGRWAIRLLHSALHLLELPGAVLSEKKACRRVSTEAKLLCSKEIALLVLKTVPPKYLQNCKTVYWNPSNNHIQKWCFAENGQKVNYSLLPPNALDVAGLAKHCGRMSIPMGSPLNSHYIWSSTVLGGMEGKVCGLM